MTDYGVIQETKLIVFEERPRRWGWLLALGILMLAGGTIGMVAAFAFTLAGVILFGALLLVGGIFQLVHGIMAKEKEWVGTLAYFALALLYILMGGFIIWDPVAASLGLTLALAALFAAMGVFRLVEAWRRRKRGWRWLWPGLAGAIEIAFSLVIVLHWPVSGLWVIGLLIAIELLLNGWLLIFAALAARRFAKEVKPV
jgi:uncharacterized membrane protein HdeD (DUF308 family)